MHRLRATLGPCLCLTLIACSEVANRPGMISQRSGDRAQVAGRVWL